MTADRDSSVAFRLLGEMEVWRNGHKIDMGGVKQRGVLSVLLYKPNRLVTRQKIIDLVWSRDEQDRLGSVEKLVPDYLSRSRHCFRKAEIAKELVRLSATRNGEPGYQITVDINADDAAVSIDWHQFCLHRAEGRLAHEAGDIQDAVGCFSTALELWRGRALEDLGPALEPIRREMTNGRLAAAEDLAAIFLEHGDPQQAVPILEELTVEYPGRERAAALLIRALGLIGRPDDAFIVHKRTLAHLADERDVDPTGVLQRAYQDVLHRGHSGRVDSSARHASSDLPYDTRHFLGRDREVRQVSGVLGDPANVSNSVAIYAVDGMAGVGKTAFAVHVAHKIAESFSDGVLFLDLHGSSAGTATRRPSAAAR